MMAQGRFFFSGSISMACRDSYDVLFYHRIT